ncbi:MAG: CaiB/BaiF CoA transferase family protein [Granulosicoccus sp.]
MAGPLSSVRILDLSNMISGPLGAMILADQGADVIKVESPAGDSSRHVATRRGGFSASFLNNNRNKRSIVLDLKKEGATAALHQLISTADVVIQNFRPGVVDRLDIGYERAKKISPKIIYASISGFGQTGPYAHKPVFDPLVQSLSGLTTIQAGSNDRRPTLVRTIVPDKLTGFTIAQSVSAALFARERSGEGQHIQLSMLDTVVYFLWSSDMGGHTFSGDELESETAQSFIDLIYETADGYMSVAAFRRTDWEKLADACECPEWKTDHRFLTTAGLEEFKNERLQLTQNALLKFTTSEWIKRLDKYDVPHAPVLTRGEMIEHPQITANGLLVENEHPYAGNLRQPRSPALFSGTPAEYRMGGPQLGEHTLEILEESGIERAHIEQLLITGAASAWNNNEN